MMLTVNVNGLKEGADPSTFDLEVSKFVISTSIQSLTLRIIYDSLLHV